MELTVKDITQPQQANKPITFSVIMPCYNSAAYVRDAVDSILQQTYKGWELIAVNDGSTDETLTILQHYAKADPRIKLFSKENGGYASAVNYGLDYVSGDYFLFLGSDDQLSTDLFQNISDKISDRAPDLIGFKAMKHWPSKSEIDPKTSFDSFAGSFNTDIATFQKDHPRESEIFFVRDTAKCFGRKLLGSIRYYGKTGLDADGIFSMKMAHRATSFMSVPVVGYHWTLRSDSVSGRPLTNKVNVERIHNWIEFFQGILSHESERLPVPEIDYISYFIQIIQMHYRFARKNGGDLKAVHAGIDTVKQVLKKYHVSVSASSHLFLSSPAAWCQYRKTVRLTPKITRKVSGFLHKETQQLKKLPKRFKTKKSS